MPRLFLNIGAFSAVLSSPGCSCQNSLLGEGDALNSALHASHHYPLYRGSRMHYITVCMRKRCIILGCKCIRLRITLYASRDHIIFLICIQPWKKKLSITVFMSVCSSIRHVFPPEGAMFVCMSHIQPQPKNKLAQLIQPDMNISA